MTANSTRTRELDIQTIVWRAYQLAGLTPAEQGSVSNEKASLGRDLLELEIDALQAAGIVVRAVDFYSLTVAAGTASYTLPTYTIDLAGVGMYLPTGQTTGEARVEPISREEYHALTDKVSRGRPSRMYLHRLATMTLYVWPVPDAAGTINLQVHKLLGDNDDGSKTLDLERHWVDYIIHALASKLAFAHSLPLDRVGYLRGAAEAKMKAAMARSKSGLPSQMVVQHSTAWRR